MDNKNCESKEIIQRIIDEERERIKQILKLERELEELEKDGEMCDTKKITEIINELNIINPPPKNGENDKNVANHNIITAIDNDMGIYFPCHASLQELHILLVF